MNKIFFITASYLFVLLVNPLVSTATDYGSLLKTMQGAVSEGSGQNSGESSSGSSGMSQSQIVDGLKQALEIGTVNTVQALSKAGGYYDNPKVKIPLPGPVEKFAGILRATGFDSQLNEFELSMNRAAEKAAPKAKELFVDAIKQMSFSDASKILNGPDNAATEYFKDKTTNKLQTLFKPIVTESMEKVGVTKAYQAVAGEIKTLPLAGNYVVDLDSYVTDKSIDGLFVRLAEEEAKIRTDPAARVTDLLKKVFQ